MKNANTIIATKKECVSPQATKRPFDSGWYKRNERKWMCVSLWNRYSLCMLCYFLSWVVYLVSLNLMLECVTMCDKGSHSQVMFNIFKMELLGVRSFFASCMQLLDTIRRLRTSLHYFYWNSHPLGLWECSFILRKWPVLRCSVIARHNKLSCCLT